MDTNPEHRFPPLLLTEGGPGDALMRRLKLGPLGLRARRVAVVLALVAPNGTQLLPRNPRPAAPSGCTGESCRSRAARYTRLFERKWVRGIDATDESLLGTGDIQSLADLGNSYENLKKLRPVPIAFGDFVAMAIPGAVPALLLATAVMPVSEILKGLLHLLA